MGDRSNVAIISQWDGATVLYSHWGGSSLFKQVQEILFDDKARNRWTDAPYLRRIVFQYIVDLDGPSETGFGISSKIGDNEHLVLTLDTDSLRAAFRSGGNYDKPVSPDEGWSFEVFRTVRVDDY